MNTLDNGQASILILQNVRKKSYLGIIYEFAIVLESDDKDQLMKDLRDAAKGYLSVVRKEKMSPALLNKSYMLPKEYKELFEEFRNRLIIGKPTQKLPKQYEEAIGQGRASISLALPTFA